MKKVIAILLLSSVSAWAGYDYEITSSSPYVWDLTLTGTQTLLMTGGGGYI